MVTNSLLLSRLWHILRVVTVPVSWITKIQALVRKFVFPFWPHPAWDTACLKKEHGGLNIVHVQHQQLALQLIFLQRLIKPTSPDDFCTPIIQDLVQYYSGISNGEAFCKTQGPMKNLFKGFPSLLTLWKIICQLPTPPQDAEVLRSDWMFALPDNIEIAVDSASPRTMRFALHPQYQWCLSPPQPPLTIPLGWRLSKKTWKSFWKVDMEHKTRTIWWRLLHGSLPTRERQHRFGHPDIQDSLCIFCQGSTEDDYHFVMGCHTKDHLWLDTWPGPNFPPSPEHIWQLIMAPSNEQKERIIMRWIGKVLLAVWKYHWICVFEQQGWQRKIALATYKNIVS